MTASIWQADGRQPVQDVDFLVIGAGLVGAAAAYFARAAGHEVTITDRGDFASGASGRNAGFMMLGLDSYYHQSVARYGEATVREMWQISSETLAFWRDMVERSKGEVPYESQGSYLLSESAQEAKDLEEAARAMQAAGIDCIFHPKDPLGRGYFNAIEKPGDGAVHPVKLAQAVLRESDADFIPNNEVYDIQQPAHDVVMVYSRKWIFRARQVLLCTNGYSPLLNPYFKGKIIPTRGQVMVTEPLSERPLQQVCYSRYGYMYFRSTFDNRLLIGGCRDLFRTLEHDTTEDRLTMPVQDALDEYYATRFPELKVPIAQRWSGIMGFSIDGLPLVGMLPQLPRVGFVAGFTGHGLSLGAGTARRAVDYLLKAAPLGSLDAKLLDQA